LPGAVINYQLKDLTFSNNQKMKKIILFTGLLLLFGHYQPMAQQPGVRTILDSMEVLKKLGGFVDGISQPPTAEQVRYEQLVLMLFELPFNEVQKLLLDKDKLARTYGFTIAAKRYFDQLREADLMIFNDTASLLLYTPTGIIDPGVTVGEYCKMGYQSVLEERVYAAKEKDVIAAIKNFIRQNARYPESYEPGAFTGYHWGGEHNREYFEILHKYRLKQADGKEVDAADYFILDSQYKIMLIETIRSDTVYVSTPRCEEWIGKFGKGQ
jgi:hypothetical protein